MLQRTFHQIRESWFSANVVSLRVKADGTGILVIDDETKEIQQGSVVYIRKGQKYTVKSITVLHFVEILMDDKLIEE